MTKAKRFCDISSYLKVTSCVYFNIHFMCIFQVIKLKEMNVSCQAVMLTEPVLEYERKEQSLYFLRQLTKHQQKRTFIFKHHHFIMNFVDLSHKSQLADLI